MKLMLGGLLVICACDNEMHQKNAVQSCDHLQSTGPRRSPEADLSIPEPLEEILDCKPEFVVPVPPPPRDVEDLSCDGSGFVNNVFSMGEAPMLGINTTASTAVYSLGGRKFEALWSPAFPPRRGVTHVFESGPKQITFVNYASGTEDVVRLIEVNLVTQFERRLVCKVPSEHYSGASILQLPNRPWPSLLVESPGRNGHVILDRDQEGNYHRIAIGTSAYKFVVFDHLGRDALAEVLPHRSSIRVRQGTFGDPDAFLEEIPFQGRILGGERLVAGHFRSGDRAELAVVEEEGEVFVAVLEDRVPHSSRTTFAAPRSVDQRVADLDADGLDDLILIDSGALWWLPGHPEGLRPARRLDARPFEYAQGFLGPDFVGVARWKGTDVLLVSTKMPGKVQIVRPDRRPFVIDVDLETDPRCPENARRKNAGPQP